ncbi:MAG: family 10 glycosylhydrolase [Leptolyngbyaceae cyanobacterium SM1_1_3]|nr:family 10 glycosylhydrolase [Leptolyngbyaceae cyanobacterium SM1_1_3]
MGLPVEFGYDPVTIALYQQEHSGKAPPAEAQNAAWVRWRADKISDFMAEVAQVVRARRPGAIVSVFAQSLSFLLRQLLARLANLGRARQRR